MKLFGSNISFTTLFGSVGAVCMAADKSGLLDLYPKAKPYVSFLAIACFALMGKMAADAKAPKTEDSKVAESETK